MEVVRVLDMMLTSSSEEEDDFEDFDMILVPGCRCHYRRRIPRVQYFIETVVDAYNEEDFRRTFRYILIIK